MYITYVCRRARLRLTALRQCVTSMVFGAHFDGVSYMMHAQIVYSATAVTTCLVTTQYIHGTARKRSKSYAGYNTYNILKCQCCFQTKQRNFEILGFLSV